MSHDHHSDRESTGNIKLAFFLNLFFAIFELVGSFYTNSLAVFSTGLHDLGDSFSLGLSWYLDKLSKKKSDRTFSYGYRRFSLLGAFINSMVLIAGSLFLISEAVSRIMNPEHSSAQGMLLFAIIGITVNSVAVLRMMKGKTQNEKVLIWHLLDDVFGWASVLIVSLFIMIKDLHILDPILSLVVTSYILWKVLKNFKATVMIFLQSVPDSIDLKKIESSVMRMNDVVAIHDVHLWSLDGEKNVLTIHVMLKQACSEERALEIKCEVKKLMTDHDIQHSTIEIERESEKCDLEKC